ncbi:MAG: ABC transporter substrate-binding protein [Burkholderiaceae bacterium]
MKKLFTRLVAASLAAGAIMVTAPAVQAKTFKWAFQGSLTSLDPHSLFETFTLGFHGNVYEGLVRRNDKMELVGALAESWENVEPNVWRFKLRQGVKFHDGSDFKSDDVVFSVERINTEGSDMKVIASMFTSAKAVDDYTVDLITPAPNPIVPLQLEIFHIMDKQWADKHGTTQATNVKGGDEGNYANLHANGTGPFMITEHQSGVKTLLKRNPDYWDKSIATNVDEVVFTPVSSDATRVAALISGDVDMAYPIPVQDWKRLEDAAGVRPLTGPEARTIFLGFDQVRDELLGSNVKGKNPFKDVRVRQAFYQAINIEAIRDKVMRGAATPAGLMIAPQINGFNEELNKRFPYDVEGARKLMAEAGYPDGFEVTMDCPNDRYVNDEKICQAAASMLARIKVKVNLLAQPKGKYFAKVLAQNGYDTSFFLLGWTPSTFDSLNVITSLFACRGGPDKIGAFNLGGYCNPRINELAAKIQSETDPDKRQALIDEANKLHRDEFGHIPLHQQPLSWGVSDKVEVVQRPDNVFDLRYVVMK